MCGRVAWRDIDATIDRVPILYYLVAIRKRTKVSVDTKVSTDTLV
jgi:hypothetical protein